ncbi:MAG: MFS transporter [Eubacteriales bacterium]
MDDVKRENGLLWSTVFVFSIAGFCETVIGNFVPFLREAYGFDYEFAGLLISSASVGGFVAVILSGILPSYLGRKISIMFWSLWIVIGYAILGVGISVPILLLIAFFGTGVSRGGSANFSSTMMALLSPKNSSRGFLLVHGGFAIGALLSPLLLVYLVANGFSWKVMAGILCGLATIRLLYYIKMDIPEIERKEKGISAKELDFLKDRYFWLGGVILFFYVSVEIGICGWLVTYFQDMGILSSEISQLTNSLFWSAMLVGRIVGGVVTNKIKTCTLLVINAFGMTVFIFVMLLSTSTISALFGLAGVSFFMATMYPATYGFGSTNLGGNDFGCSMLNLLPSLGSVIAPALVGLVAGKWGIQMGMGLLAVYTVVLLIVVLFTAWIMRKH